MSAMDFLSWAFALFLAGLGICALTVCAAKTWEWLREGDYSRDLDEHNIGRRTQ